MSCASQSCHAPIKAVPVLCQPAGAEETVLQRQASRVFICADFDFGTGFHSWLTSRMCMIHIVGCSVRCPVWW
jgi:hypothetical protein